MQTNHRCLGGESGGYNFLGDEGVANIPKKGADFWGVSLQGLIKKYSLYNNTFFSKSTIWFSFWGFHHPKIQLPF